MVVKASFSLRNSLAVGVPIINAAAHFGRIACDYCESWDILFLYQSSLFILGEW